MGREREHPQDPREAPEGGSSEDLPGEYKIGAVLGRAREEKGLSLQEVEQATKIRKRYLDGLEREDYGVLPDSVYAQGFLKTYANYLGLDGEELSRELKRRRGRRRDQRGGNQVNLKKPRNETPMSPGGISGAGGKKVTPATLLTLVIAILVLVAVIGTLYYIGQDSSPGVSNPGTPSRNADEAAASATPASDRSPQDPGAASKGAKPGKESDGPAERLNVAVDVEGSASWLSVQTDGTVPYAKVTQPGFSDTFKANENVTINTGNAGSVRVEINGQNVGALGDDGEVVARTFTLKDAS